ncbi:MAG: pectate lyase, partial [Rikenellaceae bacterium]|nr:pectate lyase [Rikenellaceae bacterium]
YRLTGNTKYLARIPDAFAWLESIRIPETDYHYFETRRLPQDSEDILCPTFVEIGTNKGLYLHLTDPPKETRHYYVDYDMTRNILAHYSSVRVIQLSKMRREYDELLSTPVEEATRDSPLKNTGLVKPPKYFSQYRTLRAPGPEQISALFAELNAKGYWAGRVPDPAREYIGLGPNQAPTEVISTMAYIRNMTTLIWLLDREAK